MTLGVEEKEEDFGILDSDFCCIRRYLTRKPRAIKTRMADPTPTPMPIHKRKFFDDDLVLTVSGEDVVDCVVAAREAVFLALGAKLEVVMAIVL